MPGRAAARLRPGSRAVHGLAVATAVATLALLVAGALVTSTGSGLAVPDWPLSFGRLFPPMVGGVLFEHGHRLVGWAVGLLTLALTASVLFGEPRRGVRALAVVALLAVVAQGVLGGVTVLYELPLVVSVMHACLAQVFFSLVVAIAVVTGHGWVEVGPVPRQAERPTLFALAALGTAATFVQLVLGALVRHSGAGLAVPDFPLAFGRLIPPLAGPEVAIHLAHRAGALLVGVAAGWVLARVVRCHAREPRLLRPAFLAAGLFLLQVGLGGAIIWTRAAVLATTAHLLVGAVLLATWVALALHLGRAGMAGSCAAARAGLGVGVPG